VGSYSTPHKTPRITLRILKGYYAKSPRITPRILKGYYEMTPKILKGHYEISPRKYVKDNRRRTRTGKGSDQSVQRLD